MPSVAPCELPQTALLRRYLREGTYTDCYVTDVARPVSQAEYVETFYTTLIFRIERLILKWLVARPSTDDEARRLAGGSIAAFAAWTVEARDVDQLLLCDLYGRTRSWLMVAPIASNHGVMGTRLYFGSAVVPITDPRTGMPTRGHVYNALLGFHKLYSRMLLAAARSRLARSN
jgi:hypothetical protein